MPEDEWLHCTLSPLVNSYQQLGLAPLHPTASHSIPQQPAASHCIPQHPTVSCHILLCPAASHCISLHPTASCCTAWKSPHWVLSLQCSEREGNAVSSLPVLTLQHAGTVLSCLKLTTEMVFMHPCSEIREKSDCSAREVR